MKRSQQLAQYASAEELERYLGDPLEEGRVFSFKSLVELDEREEYPEKAHDLLNEWGLHHYYIPQEYGGRLCSFEELISLVRVVARRDVTATVAHVNTYLGAAAVWVAGTEEQKHKLAGIIKNARQVSFALTERAHGSDILASEVRAICTAGGYMLRGEKWLIGNATRSAAMTVFARSDENGGPRGFSMLLVEKKRVEKSSLAYLPKVKTHGLRGADISGVRFENSEIASDCLIGALGSGLETSVKMLQLTRSIVPALSLGAAETALQATISFALFRSLYGDTVFAIPHVRTVLVNAFIDLLICECLTTATARAIHVAPEQLSIFSAVVKYFVPTTVDNMVRNLSVVMGARYYLREGHWSGIFQKIVRDNAVASLFDGSTVVNLHVISLQLRRLADGFAKTGSRVCEELGSTLESVFATTAPLPVFNPNRLELQNRGRNEILQGLGLTLTQLQALLGDASVENKTVEEVIALTNMLIGELSTISNSLAKFTTKQMLALERSEEMYSWSKKYCILHTAAVCIQFWIYNRPHLGEFFAKGEWLALALDRLLAPFNASRSRLPAFYTANVARELEMISRRSRLSFFASFD